jgi:PEP-CTERM motif
MTGVRVASLSVLLMFSACLAFASKLDFNVAGSVGRAYSNATPEVQAASLEHARGMEDLRFATALSPMVIGSLRAGSAFRSSGDFVSARALEPIEANFEGTFNGPMPSTFIPLANGTRFYALASVLPGALEQSRLRSVALQLAADRASGLFDDPLRLAGGETRIGSVPEPSTFALLASGCLSLLGMIRRKLN